MVKIIYYLMQYYALGRVRLRVLSLCTVKYLYSIMLNFWSFIRTVNFYVISLTSKKGALEDWSKLIDQILSLINDPLFVMVNFTVIVTGSALFPLSFLTIS